MLLCDYLTTLTPLGPTDVRVLVGVPLRLTRSATLADQSLLSGVRQRLVLVILVPRQEGRVWDSQWDAVSKLLP